MLSKAINRVGANQPTLKRPIVDGRQQVPTAARAARCQVFAGNLGMSGKEHHYVSAR